MDNQAKPGSRILVIEFDEDGVRAVLLASVPEAIRAALREEPTPPAPRLPRWDSLTKRERIVARLVGQALTNQQIASRIRVSPHTVNYHLRQIYRKLGINSRVQLARLAVEAERSPR